ncbi:hypothetical protein NQ317_014502 [Molorchus minor]|uniref:Uncharacterized protein n=1 Tax=Molorchus minor TaxID=1323400 RepID=A0ABQ9IX51_9CUCU|nr:hypothetical protein NQ317_014502 [Molorchus minor]
MSTNSKRDELEPKTRIRSSSATESSKPNSVYRKQPAMQKQPHLFPQDSPSTNETQNQLPLETASTVTTAQHSIEFYLLFFFVFGSAGNICHQRTQSLPLTDHPTTTNAPPTDNTPVQPCSRAINNTATAKRSNQSSKCILGGRERSVSMPSRPRTTSEPIHPLPVWRLVPHHRSQCRDISHSPPSGSPVSPPSVGCSTDSTGSSYSLADDADVCTECPEPMRYSIPLTPDEAIAEEDCADSPCGIYESYVPMAAPSSDDGYMDMSPRCPHNMTSPSASMSSVTSGTPSTDLRFTDYPLDKVSSYFTSEDDDARPARAYSVGSRPETYRGKRHIELAGTPENSRVRAFSVGSKTKKGPCRVLPPHYPHPGAKSSSAPILSNSRTHSSHGSIGPMDDLMEMDFSRSSTGGSTNSGYTDRRPGTTKENSGYVEMKPGVDLTQVKSISTTDVSPYVDMSSENASYVDMSGSSPAKGNITTPQEDYSSFVDVARQYNWLLAHEPARNNNYVDMDHRKNRTYSSSSNTTRASSSPGSYPWGGDYLDMSGSQKKAERNSQSSQLSSSPNVSVSPKNNEYMPFNRQECSKPMDTQPKTPEGYVEMTPGNKKHQRQSSLDSTQMVRGNEDYTNMSLGSASKKKPTKKEKTRSRNQFLLLPRLASSTGTPPRMHLPLSSWSSSPYSSLPRQRVRKDSHNNSKDSSSSSVTTPSSSSTIFPMSLNSPSSPMKPSSKAETPTALKIPAAILNAIYKTNNKLTNVRARPGDDYTVMDFEPNKGKASKVDESTSDYVNYSPAAKTSIKVTYKPESMDETPGDYAVMTPGIMEPLQSAGPATSIASVSTSPLVTHMSCIGIDESKAMCFRPIKEDTRLGSTSPRPGDVVPRKLTEDTKTTATATMEGIESPYEMMRATECVSPAAKISRPNSVNGDKIKSTSPRPSLVSSEKSRPPSVASDSSRAQSRPSSTSSDLCSSGSTIVISRSESVNSDCICPDSTKNDVQLHYASLDLAQAQEEDCSRSPRLAKSSPNELGGQTQCEPTFIYAEIDFLKSEGLKNNNQSLPNNTKVKH